MNLTLTADTFSVELEPMERFWAFHLGARIDIPRAHIQSVSSTMPPLSWRVLRAPGTGLPWLVAGTFYTELGREFWYITQRDRVLTLDLTSQDYYKRLILTVEDPSAWIAQLQPLL
ncbi:MAG: hypothetical protein EA367_17670 [Leptolyngbya sp. DLM2.Bin15]|nr:MAG: hypothetical protein EA367_17670 [Leptolyngbya sp. DLM2.Bin15]